ncbi:hypothetical protein LUZ60_013594 [Juncus effusus]|nr:hypothetical protein LUZ60_013594 [Juncus effusus]
MALKQKGSEAGTDRQTKKQKRVGFASFDIGVEPNECIKVFAVRNEIEVGSTNCLPIEPVDLNHFFGEDEKIFGYRGLKINIWLSLASFHAYADISFERKSDGGKGITDLTLPLKSIFGESLLEKEEFIQTFSKDRDYIKTVIADGKVIDLNSSNSSPIQVFRFSLENPIAGFLYSRLVSLVLLLVDGGSPIDVTDPKWDIYLAVKGTENEFQLLGFATVYNFFHYPDSTRMRISQILVVPPYQSLGYGRILLEAINSVAISQNAHDVTVEGPSEYFQYLRSCMDTVRLVSYTPIQPALDSVTSFLKQTNLSKRTEKSKSNTCPPAELVDQVRGELKISRKQFLKCWDVLVYMNLVREEDEKMMESFKVVLADRVKAEIVGNKDGESNKGKRVVEVDNEYDHDMTFVMCKMEGEEGGENEGGKIGGDEAMKQEEQLNQLVEEEFEEIANVAKKVSELIAKA